MGKDSKKAWGKVKNSRKMKRCLQIEYERTGKCALIGKSDYRDPAGEPGSGVGVVNTSRCVSPS